MKKQIAFLCTANYYRSRFAEHFFNWLAPQHRLPWQADSRGLQVGQWGNIGPISRDTVLRLKSYGIIVPEPHREPLPLTLDDLHAFDHVVAVKEAEHRPQMKLQFPAWCDRVEYWHVDDLDCATPEDALPLLEIQVRALVERLAKASHHSARTTSAASSQGTFSNAPASMLATANRPG
jgi:protein-tyrosine phosphatase